MYNDGNGGEGGLNIYSVGEAGEDIVFTIALGSPIVDVTPGELNLLDPERMIRKLLILVTLLLKIWLFHIV